MSSVKRDAIIILLLVLYLIGLHAVYVLWFWDASRPLRLKRLEWPLSRF
jgi:hypothetical protein